MEYKAISEDDPRGDRVHELSTSTIDTGRKFIDNMDRFKQTLIDNSHYV